jgi:hypothetical protein
MTPLTPMTERKLHAMRRAGGLGIESPFGIGHRGEAPRANPEELQRLLAAWNPMPTSLLGFGGFIAILALMLLKPSEADADQGGDLVTVRPDDEVRHPRNPSLC